MPWHHPNKNHIIDREIIYIMVSTKQQDLQNEREKMVPKCSMSFNAYHLMPKYVNEMKINKYIEKNNQLCWPKYKTWIRTALS